MSAFDNFDGFEPVTLPCHGCGEPVRFAASDPEMTRQSVERGDTIPWCPGCFLADQAEKLLGGEATDGD